VQFESIESFLCIQNIRFKIKTNHFLGEQIMNMKKLMAAVAGKGTALLGIAMLTFFLSGCLDDDATQVAPVPRGYVSIYQASPDAPVLDVLVDNRPLGSLSYTDHSDYLNFYTGNRNLKFNVANAASALVDTTFSVADGKAYSVFVINTLSKGLETLIIADSSAAPETGKAMVRFVNLSPDAPAFDVIATSDQSNPLFQNTSFKGATEFKPIDAGTYTFDVKETGTQTSAVSANKINMQPGGFYTIITRGFVNPPTGNSNVLSIEIL
jgi:hypothetical protein